PPTFARQPSGAVDGDDRLPGAGPAGDASRTGEVPVDGLALAGVQVEHPLLPVELEGPLQVLVRLHYVEPPLGVGVGERVLAALRWRRRGLPRRDGHEELLALGGQRVADVLEERLDRGVAQRLEPGLGRAVRQELGVSEVAEGLRRELVVLLLLDDPLDDLLVALTDNDYLGRAGVGVDVQRAALDRKST